ncbi:hypothetical protein MUN89_09070 [Halobacillus salinarum]|uniref:Uncharacterized protein n=1 Tax=Halobacillus salinarum TaxID=2932257 RepID=A0ABY4EV67_9BACI|nr:hypothetical protein [Halobacillus salinarum]UOQ46046.1 hypothetical protein MUN89_09070 [Halobacillus salinarum]
MDFFRKKWVWLAPLLIVLIGISLLFIRNYKEVTEPPEKDWSREIGLGTTPYSSLPSVNSMEDGKTSISLLTHEGAVEKIYNDEFNKVDEHTYDIPVDKFTSIYLHDNNLIYSNYYSIFDGRTNKKITETDGFHPLRNQIIYQKENELFTLNPKTSASEKLLDLEHENTDIYSFQGEENTYLLLNNLVDNSHVLTFYKLSNKGPEKMGTSHFQLEDSLVAKDIQFAVHDDTYDLLVKALQKQSMSGSPTETYFFAESSFSSSPPELKPLTFQDPHGDGALKELGDIQMRIENNHPELLFKAFGATATRYNEPRQFNIYQASIEAQNIAKVTRLSNTPNLSEKPQWVNEEDVIWLDKKGDQKSLFLSSGHQDMIDKAAAVHTRNLVSALGKTAGMLSYSLFTLIIAGLWFIWPLLFIIIMMFSNNRGFDNDRPWIFYTGAFIYLAASLVFKNRLFTNGVLDRAPDYLSFTGSSFIYLLGFGLLTYGILMFGVKMRDWSMSIRIAYFVGIHLMFVMVFFGPYLL